MVMLTLLLTSLAMLSTLAGGFAAIYARRRIHLLMGFGAGVLLDFRPRRHLLTAQNYRTEMQMRFNVWREVTAIQTAI